MSAMQNTQNTGGLVFSNTNPPVALTHIFCGEIKDGEAQGFHSRYLANRNTGPKEINNPQCARATGSLYQYYNMELGSDEDMNTQLMFKSKGIEVYDRKIYIKKGTIKDNLNKFFPDAWTPHVQHVVDVIATTYRACKDQVNDKDKVKNKGKVKNKDKVKDKEDKQLCMKNYKSENEEGTEVFSIKIFTDGSDKILTAYPIDNTKLCRCNYEQVKDKFKDVKMPHTEL